MELTLPAAILAREMSLMQGVVERRTTHQILTNVLLEARDRTLTLTATDLDTTFVSEIESLSLKTAGAVTVPARRLFDVVRELPATPRSACGSSRTTTSRSTARNRSSGSGSTGFRRRTTRRGPRRPADRRSR